MATRKTRQPRIACELNGTHVVAAHAGEGNSIDLSAIRALPPGAIVPSLTGVNIVNRSAVSAAVQEAIAILGTRGRDIIAILPDAACRLVLLDFDSLPNKREETDAVVRFRLKKSLPFDVERARISWQAQGANGKSTVLAAITLSTVLDEYETLVHEAGFNAGVVLPSMLAALGQVDATTPTLVIKVDPMTTSIAMVNSNALLLARTLDHAAGRQPEGMQLVEDVYPSLVFFQDTYGTTVERILVSGVKELNDFNAALAETTGVRAQELVSPQRLGATAVSQRAALGAVAGALV